MAIYSLGYESPTFRGREKRMSEIEAARKHLETSEAKAEAAQRDRDEAEAIVAEIMRREHALDAEYGPRLDGGTHDPF